MGKLDLSSGQPQIKYTPLTAAPQLPELQNLIYQSFTFEAPEMAAVGSKYIDIIIEFTSLADFYIVLQTNFVPYTWVPR
jgi:hypothetical protein